MSFIRDLTRGGYAPLQDHRPNVDLALRIASFAARIVDRDSLARYKVHDGTTDSLGDILCAMFWPLDPAGKRPISGWAHAWPAILVAPAGAAPAFIESGPLGRPPARRPAPPPAMRPIREAYLLDPRFTSILIPPRSDAPLLPLGSVGTVPHFLQ